MAVSMERILDGRYRLIKEVGRGASSQVYLAEDALVRRIVAVKIFLDSRSSIRFFDSEVRAVTKLSHPNIVEVYDICDSKTKYMVMEYIDGVTLDEYIRYKKTLDIDEAVNCALQVLSALAEAHRNGIVHRDIKPENILIDRNGTVKITDFGIAKTVGVDSFASSEVGVGSVYYISPEQAGGKKTGPESDLYSLGVVMYHMLCGRVPFDADTPAATAMMHITDVAQAPRMVRATIPVALEKVIMRAMEKEPGARYRDAGQMRDALLTAVGRKKEKRTAAPIIDRNGRKKKTAHFMVACGVAVFVAVAVLIGSICTGVYLKNRPTDESYVMPTLVGGAYNPDIDYGGGIEISVVEYEYSDTYPKGTVIYQSVSPGTRYINSCSIKIKVSNGSGFDTGKLVGNYEQAVETILNAYSSLDLRFIYEFVADSTVPAGDIISYDAGGEVMYGSIIRLKISAGEAREAEVPNLLGMTRAEATAKLTELGILYEIEFENSDFDSCGRVIFQSAAAGSTVLIGTDSGRIKITVGK